VPVSDSPPLPAPLPPLPDVNQPATAAAEPTPAPVEEESAVTNRTIVEYQRYRQSSTRTASNGDVIELTNLNSRIGSWYVLRITQGDKTGVFHLETSIDVAGEIVLTDVEPYKVRIPRRNAVTECEFWKGPLKIQPSLPFVSICDSALLIRRRVEGHRSTKEWVVDILRDQVWGGEEITTFVKKNFFADGFMIQSDSQRDGATKDFVMTDTEGPAPARVAPESVETRSLAKELGIQLIGGLDNQFLVGRWYRTKSHPSTYVSLVQPKFLAKDALEAHKDKVAALDQVESNALHYLVAFDLSAYELHFALGTDHPRVEWSDRVLPQMRDKNLNGPDGFATVDPLVTTGMVPPRHTNRIVSAFTGGFKRTHGAFKWGQLSLVNRGSHYGFAENGVMFSKLNTGLATLAIMRDGEVIAKTWQDSDRSLIPNLLHARQNGVAIVDRHPQTGAPVPGDYVKSWGLGNWSGSQDSNLRTLRAGVCVAEANGKRFLIYGYFSSVTPSAMARVFMAYGCSYAFHLDMNALEHTYLSMISTQERGIQVEHLIQGMNVLDQVVKGKVIPRFVGFADNRDFFYLVEKQP
jgi:hypothetical protein